ncbi:MAG: hypothetical protein QF479_03370 [Candidatus Poseidoniaceae archaeon]|nr:hypothetical protein [Candidatus Poseidoniaceae archaeon]
MRDHKKGKEKGDEKMKNEKMNEEKEPKVQVELANENGHDVMMMTKPEAIKLIERNSDHWIFMSGQLVSVATLVDANWSDMAENETKVQLTPGLVGGVQ